MKLSRISALRVHYMPKELQHGFLYVSEKHESAVHLCACGCGSTVTTPITANRWSFKDSAHGPSLWPSVGNWEQPCRSHYIIEDGDIVWCKSWTPEEVMEGRAHEKAKRERYYDKLYAPWYRRFWNWLQRLWGG